MGECWVIQARSIGDAPDNIPEMMKYKCCIYKGYLKKPYPMAGTPHRHSSLLVQLGSRAARRDLVKLLLLLLLLLLEILEIGIHLGNI
jgi:hypothetical protein